MKKDHLITLESERDFINDLMSREEYDIPRDLMFHLQAMNIGLFGSERDKRIVNKFAQEQDIITNWFRMERRKSKDFDFFMLGIYFGIIRDAC